MTCQMTGLPPISTSGLGLSAVSSESRVPSPPAKMATGGWARGTVLAWSTLPRDNAPTFGINFVIKTVRCLSEWYGRIVSERKEKKRRGLDVRRTANLRYRLKNLHNMHVTSYSRGAVTVLTPALIISPATFILINLEG